jgi:CRP-like cAMP-binding protein
LTNTDRTTEDLLATVPLFARLERKSLRKMAALCVPREFDTGAEIISEGGTGLGLFIITEGRVEVTKGEGDSRVVLAELQRGALLGEMALVDDQPRSASATAIEPTRCLLITRGSFQTLVKKDSELAWCLVPALADRIRDMQQRMIERGVEKDEVTFDDGFEVRTKQARPAKRTRDEGDDEEEQSLDRFVTGLLRGQYALTIASIAAFRGVARAFEEFVRTLASETELDDSDRIEDVTRKLPRGLIEASGAGLREVERTPERLLERYRRYRDGKGST